MNGELFTNKVVRGRYGPAYDQRQAEEQEDEGIEVGEEDYDYQEGDRNLEEEYRPPRRGRGNRGGYGRGQARGYEEDEYQGQDYRPRGRGHNRDDGYRGSARAEADEYMNQEEYESNRGRGSRSRGRGGRRGTRGHRGG